MSFHVELDLFDGVLKLKEASPKTLFLVIIKFFFIRQAFLYLNIRLLSTYTILTIIEYKYWENFIFVLNVEPPFESWNFYGLFYILDFRAIDFKPRVSDGYRGSMLQPLYSGINNHANNSIPLLCWQ